MEPVVSLKPLFLVFVYRFVVHTDKIAKGELLAGSVGMGSFLLGYGINVFLLRPIYGFASYQGILFTDVGDGSFFQNLEAGIGNFLKALGYAAEYPVLSLHGIVNFIVLCLIAATGYLLINTAGHEEKGGNGVYIQFFVLSIVFNILFYGFTDDRMFIPRYVIPAITGGIPALVICFDQEKDRIKKYACLLIIVCFFVVGCMRTYYSLTVNDYNEDRYASIAFLQKEGLKFGYATSWNAGIIMELTNGEIEMVNMHDIESGTPALQTCPKKWFTGEPVDNPFLLLSQEEYQRYQNSPVVSQGTLVYEDEAFVILLYDDKLDICDYVLQE